MEYQKTIQVKQNEQTKDAYLDLEDFKDLVNIKKVAFYELTETPQGLVLQFFDKNKKLLKLKPNKK